MGRFLIGFAIGLLVGAAAALFAGPARRGQLGSQVEGAVAAARRAADLKEQELWADYRARVKRANAPAPQRPPWESV